MKGAQLVVEAMLQSPNFPVPPGCDARSEAEAYATASRLSYALWDTMPDAELFAAAARAISPRRRAWRRRRGGCWPTRERKKR